MTGNPIRDWRRHAPPFLLLAALLGLAAYLQSSPVFQPLKRSLQSKFAHRSAFPGNRMIRFLNRLGALHPEPAAAVPREERFTAARRPRGGNFDFWSLGPADPEALASTALVSPAARHWPLPVISVYMDEGLLPVMLARPERRGRRWERSAFVSYFQDGQLAFGSGAGIRIHGGASRYGSVKKSYRLYFRESYGAGRFPPGILFDPATDPLRHLVVHNDIRHDDFGNEWHLVNPLAYDISRRIGALVPATQPAAFWLNGELQGLYVLTEHLDSNYLQSRYGHQQFIAVRAKLTGGGWRFRLGDPTGYWQLMNLAKSADQRSLREIAERVDLESLSRWLISVLVCGTTDWNQGLLLLDQTRAGAKWFWINWDMDHSFMSAAGKKLEKPWEVELLQQIAFEGRRNARALLLRDLIENKPAYRAYLMNLYAEALNHRLSEEFIRDRLRYYRRVGQAFGLPDVSFVDRAGEYLTHRKPILRRRMGEMLEAGAEHRVTVTIPPGRTVEIDGHTKTGNYSGWYFDTVPLNLRVAKESGGDFAYWRVGAMALSEPEVELKIDQDTTIEAVFAAGGYDASARRGASARHKAEERAEQEAQARLQALAEVERLEARLRQIQAADPD